MELAIYANTIRYKGLAYNTSMNKHFSFLDNRIGVNFYNRCVPIFYHPFHDVPLSYNQWTNAVIIRFSDFYTMTGSQRSQVITLILIESLPESHICASLDQKFTMTPRIVLFQSTKRYLHDSFPESYPVSSEIIVVWGRYPCPTIIWSVRLYRDQCNLLVPRILRSNSIIPWRFQTWTDCTPRSYPPIQVQRTLSEF